MKKEYFYTISEAACFIIENNISRYTIKPAGQIVLVEYEA